MKNKHILLGITSASSYVLLKGSIEYLIKMGYHVSLVSEYSADLLKTSKAVGFDYYHIRIKREISLLNDIISLLEILVVLHKVKPSICNFGTPKIALLGVFAARILRVERVVYTCRGIRYFHETGFKRLLLKSMEWVTIKFSHKTIFIAPSLETFVKSEMKIDSKKYYSILPGSSNGIDLTYFNSANFGNCQLPKTYTLFLSSVVNPFVVTFIGRIIDRKGWRELYRAFKQLKLKYKNVLLVFVGDFEYEQISDLNLTEELRSDQRVYISGWTNDVRPYLSKSSVLVNPSYWEGFGNVFLQGAACGIPVIAGDSIGCVDAISNGFNGFLVDPFSSDDIFDKISFFIEDPDLINYMGTNGIVFAEKFESTRIWNQYISIYEDSL